MQKNDVEESVRRCYSTWGERYYADYYAGAGAYPPVHTDLIRKLLQQSGAKTLLDAGCGPASMLRDLNLPGLQRYGFDLTPEMVAEGRRILAAQGVPESRLWEGNVLNQDAFQAPVGAPAAGFDAVICFGVLPHIPAEADGRVLQNLMDAVRPGGWLACEARNELFGLFTLNRYSRDFFCNRLMRVADLQQQAADGAEQAALETALTKLAQHFRLDLPPVRQGHTSEPGYDEILSRLHNPFELRALAEGMGLQQVRVLFYHYHALPPMLEAVVPNLFRRASLTLEDATDWRGHFMASAFILTGQCV